jgi:excisionase family DNA binding protein
MELLTVTNTTPQELAGLLEKLLDDKLKQYFGSAGAKHTNTDIQLLSRKEAAKVLGISLVTLNEWTKNGLVIAHKVGTKVYYKKTDLEQSLRQIKTRR